MAEPATQILLNVQTDSLRTAVILPQMYPNRIIIGVTAQRFPALDEGIALIRQTQENGVLVSAGLGDGAADQWQRALDLALATRPFHLNHVFPAAALSRRALKDAGAAAIVNGLIKPSGVTGAVRIGTRPLSASHGDETVSAELAINLLHEVGVETVKFFPLRGLRHLDELARVAEVAVSRNMMIEPTGGLTPKNLPSILETCIGAGARRIMPHLYTSVEDPRTRDLDLGLVGNPMATIDRAQQLGVE